jgi:hypothetical protein
LLPLQPPLALQLVEFAADHVSVVEPPLGTVVGAAVSAIAGGGVVPAELTATLTDWVADLPDPVQVKANDELLVSGPVLAEPAVGLMPLQLPDAVQLFALAEDHVSVAALPELTLEGATESETEGLSVPGVCNTLATTV